MEEILINFTFLDETNKVVKRKHMTSYKYENKSKKIKISKKTKKVVVCFSVFDDCECVYCLEENEQSSENEESNENVNNENEDNENEHNDTELNKNKNPEKYEESLTEKPKNEETNTNLTDFHENENLNEKN